MMEPTGRTVLKSEQGKTWSIDSFGQIGIYPYNFARLYELNPDVTKKYYVCLSDVETCDEIPVYKEMVLTVSGGSLLAGAT